ncbi:unnamed protein product [Caenorhabditis angaria]|uniref:ABC transporter domain-containing protein n=1 Tax=Caenorhabditis angaria TaxID=860376 RepID=A0A9P1I8V1_9PELO|nr:unnamed protein product [Caenorhabditis angaria]
MLLFLLKKDVLLAKRNLVYTLCELFLTLFVFGICGGALYYQSINSAKMPLKYRMIPPIEFDTNRRLQRRSCYENYKGCAKVENGGIKKLVEKMKQNPKISRKNPSFVGRNLRFNNSKITLKYVLPMQNIEHSKNNWRREKSKQDISESLARNMLIDYDKITKHYKRLPLSQRSKIISENISFAKVYEMPYLEPSPVSKSLEYLPVFCFFSFYVLTVTATRGIVLEKTTSRPYLLLIGLPLHVYYIEQFIFNYLKSVIFVTPGAILIAMIFDSIEEQLTIFFSIILFLLPTISFSFLIGSIFRNQKTAFQCGLIFWNLLAIIPYRFKLENYEMNVEIYSIPTSFLFNYCFHFIVDSMKKTYDIGQFSISSSKTSKMAPIYYYMLMLVIDSIIMLTLAIFFDYNRKILSTEWILSKFQRKQNIDSDEENTDLNVLLETRKPLMVAKKANKNEEIRQKMPSDIEINNLFKKVPNGENVINNLNLRAIRGEVSVILGQNGCGKSMTFSIISGITNPTSGSIMINGMNVFKNRRKVGKMIGICPLDNMLFEKLTVWEHLKIVHSIKKPKTIFKDEAKLLLETMKMADNKHTLVKNLSTGTKRKLSMCMALIGNSKVILLDEPTTGLDPCARLEIQKILESLKIDRTILLTTHEMDEAERLSDWIYIMEKGRIVACGDSQYLKTNYGGGHLLTVVLLNKKKQKKEAIESLLNICNVFMKNVKLKDIRGQIIEILISDENKKNLLELVRTLEQISDKQYDSPAAANIKNYEKIAKKIEISSIGLSLNSLEQSFLAVLNQCDTEKRDKHAKFRDYSNMINEKAIKPIHKMRGTFSGLFWKRVYYAKRNILQHLITYIFPILVLILINIYHLPEHFPNIVKNNINLNSLPKSKVIFQMPNSQKYIDVFRSNSNLELIHLLDMSINIIDIYNEYDQPGDRVSLIIRGSNNTAKEIYVNTRIQLNKPILIFVRNFMPTFNDLKNLSISVFWVIQESSMGDSHIRIYFTFWTKICSIVMFFGVMLVEDHVSKFQHQQFLTEMPHFFYWFYTIFWEFILFFIDLLIFVIIMFCFNIATFTVPLLFVISILFFFAMVPVFLVISMFVDSPIKMTISAVSIVYISTGLKVVITQAVRLIWNTDSRIFEAFRWMFPSLNFFANLFKLWNWERPFDLSSEIAVGFLHYKNAGENYSIWQDYIYLIPLMILTSIIFLFLAMRRVKKLWFSIRICSKKVSKPKKEKSIDSMVILNDVTKKIGKKKVVNKICLNIKNEESFGIIGLNGCGKSVIIDILACKTFLSSGTAEIGGRNVMKWIKSGYCPQNTEILPDFSGKEILYTTARLQNYKDIKKVVGIVTKCVGLTKNDMMKQVKNMSKGQQRKLSIGIAVLSRSKILILDNPTTGLDPKSRRDIWNFFEYLNEECGITVIMNTQSMNECEALCTRMAVLRDGQIIALGTTQEIKERHGLCFHLSIILKDSNNREKLLENMKERMKESILISENGLIFVYQIPRKFDEKWTTKVNEIEEYLKDLDIDYFYLLQSTLSEAFIKLNS